MKEIKHLHGRISHYTVSLSPGHHWTALTGVYISAMFPSEPLALPSLPQEWTHLHRFHFFVSLIYSIVRMATHSHNHCCCLP